MNRTEVLRECVLDLSVYNCVSLGKRDMGVLEVVNVLRARWQPAWDLVENVVTPDSVRDAATRLDAHGLVSGQQEKICIPDRESEQAPRVVTMDYKNARLVWRGRK